MKNQNIPDSRKGKSFILILACTFLLIANSNAQSNRALDLNGAGAYANLGTINPPGNFSAGLTIECWVRWNGFGTWSRLIDMGNGPGSDNILLANEGSSSSLRFEVYNNGATEGISCPLFMDPSHWYHVAVTQDNFGYTIIYIDGNEVVSGFIQLPQDITRNNCYIGRSNWGGDDFLNGSVDEMKIWNIALTRDQIRQHMLKPVVANSAGLVAYYNCNEGSGTVLTNLSSNGMAANASAEDGLGWIASPIQSGSNSLGMDGMDDHVFIGSVLPYSSSYTKEAWVYVTKNTVLPNHIISSYGCRLWISNGRLQAGNNSSMAEVADPGVFPASTWVHVAVSYNAPTGELLLYRDGVLVATGFTANPYPGEDNYIGSGSDGANAQSFMGGQIDEVRIWNVARTQTEIQMNMNHELVPSIENDLVAYYNFNQGIASGDNAGMTTVIDQKGTFNGIAVNLDMNGGLSNFVQQTNALIILPVRFTSFTAQKQNNQVLLQWSTASEVNSQEFVVEHSNNGTVWNRIATIPAAVNSNESKQYSFLHVSPVKGRNSYRIRQRDLDGKSSTTIVRTVMMEEREKIVSILNPVITNGRLQLQLIRPAMVALFTQDGRMLLNKELSAGLQNIELGSYAKGVYFLHCAGVTEKIVLR